MSRLQEPTTEHNPGQAIMQGTAPKLVRIAYLAERLDIPASTIYAMAADDRIPGLVRLGRTLHFDADKIEAWIASGGGSI